MNIANTIRLVLVGGALALAAPVEADQHMAIINVAGCASITWPNRGFAVLEEQFWMSNGVEDDVEVTAVLLCDADFPPDATTFDYAEFEYSPASADMSPTLSVLQVWRVVQADGSIESWFRAVGQCGGDPPVGSGFGPYLPTNPMQLPINICQTQGNVDLAGLAAASPGAEASLVFLVVLPVVRWELGDYGTGSPQAFRIAEYYEQ